MNPFEQPIPSSPIKAGANYFEDKKKAAEQKYDQRKEYEEQEKQENLAPFDKPLSPEQKKEETSIEKKLRLLNGINSNISRLEEELMKFPGEIKGRTSQAKQIEELEVYKEQLLSEISPEELEDYIVKE